MYSGFDFRHLPSDSVKYANAFVFLVHYYQIHHFALFWTCQQVRCCVTDCAYDVTN